MIHELIQKKMNMTFSPACNRKQARVRVQARVRARVRVQVRVCVQMRARA